MVERRRHQRYNLAYEVVVYASVVYPKAEYSAKTFNVSLGGIGLRLKNSIKDSEQVTLLIYSPDKEKPVEAKGKLVWQSRFHDIGVTEHRAGIQFIAIPWSEITRLLRNNV